MKRFALFGIIICMFVVSCGNKTYTCVMSLENTDYAVEHPFQTMCVFYNVQAILSQRHDVKVIDRTRFEEVKKEHAFQMSDYSDKQKNAEIGKVLGADCECFVSVKDGYYTVDIMNLNTTKYVTHKGRFKANFFGMGNTVKVKDLGKIKKIYQN